MQFSMYSDRSGFSKSDDFRSFGRKSTEAALFVLAVMVFFGAIFGAKPLFHAYETWEGGTEQVCPPGSGKNSRVWSETDGVRLGNPAPDGCILIEE